MGNPPSSPFTPSLIQIFHLGLGRLGFRLHLAQFYLQVNSGGKKQKTKNKKPKKLLSPARPGASPSEKGGSRAADGGEALGDGPPRSPGGTGAGSDAERGSRPGGGASSSLPACRRSRCQAGAPSGSSGEGVCTAGSGCSAAPVPSRRALRSPQVGSRVGGEGATAVTRSPLRENAASVPGTAPALRGGGGGQRREHRRRRRGRAPGGRGDRAQLARARNLESPAGTRPIRGGAPSRVTLKACKWPRRGRGRGGAGWAPPRKFARARRERGGTHSRPRAPRAAAPPPRVLAPRCAPPRRRRPLRGPDWGARPCRCGSGARSGAPG